MGPRNINWISLVIATADTLSEHSGLQRWDSHFGEDQNPRVPFHQSPVRWSSISGFQKLRSVAVCWDQSSKPFLSLPNSWAGERRVCTSYPAPPMLREEDTQQSWQLLGKHSGQLRLRQGEQERNLANCSTWRFRGPQILLQYNTERHTRRC